MRSSPIGGKSCGANRMTEDGETEGATGGDDASGLLLSHLTTRAMRNAVELEEIGRAYDKHVFRGRRKKAGTPWLTDDVIRRVHRDMFGAIWAWAGRYRRSDTNIGVSWHQIPEQIRVLCDDFAFWDSTESRMPVLEIAARLQNRLTRIHPFVNGNGRHARLVTDIFFRSRRHPLPQWPQIQLMPQGDAVRRRYIEAMKKADGEDHADLMAFMAELTPKKATDG